ncbi:MULTISPECIES: hypothetical protein [Bradyrhizobium]|uniref:hypothetical protein n=1 Tax=Bradyrhizobium TaxID=374 RepID=UPI001CE23D3C|nr:MULTISPECIES: hypothetical protein [Bradyrhizobium]MCA6104391.1 hypothetical protein [Bradyrhizobium australafricanum]MCC8972844.1 hypothetical protein [Bradyrhizobium brasilense]
MRNYTAYILGPDGHIANRLDLLCCDDEAAKERAKTYADDYQIELWDGDRLIGQFKPRKRSRVNRYA